MYEISRRVRSIKKSGKWITGDNKWDKKTSVDDYNVIATFLKNGTELKKTNDLFTHFTKHPFAGLQTTHMYNFKPKLHITLSDPI